MVVPSPSIPGSKAISADKVSLRRGARVARRDFVDSLDGQARSQLELDLASHLSPLVERSRVTGAYCPLPYEISPLPALAGATTIAFPAFTAPHLPFRFLAGGPIEIGPFAALQPSLVAPEVFPDLVLVPLVAVDRAGTRLGQGKGHYDRVLGELKRRGALLVGVGWAVQLIDTTIPVDPWDVPLDGFASPQGVELWR
jgi:5-formyltetrahydrofolate cyclo-ligase